MIAYAKIEDSERKIVSYGEGDLPEYEKYGMTKMEIEQGYDGNWYIAGYAPKQPLSEVRTTALSRIDSATSSAILAGFEYEVETGEGKEVLYFSYDSFDQQNFADTANGALLAMQGIEGLPTTIKWNGWRNHTSEYKGDLVRLELDASAFLAFYTSGALVHKVTQMEIGGQRKEIIKGCETVDEIKAYLAEWGM